MRSKDVIEALLFTVKNKNFMKKALEVCHLINDHDRNYVSKEHKEFGFMEYFEEPRIICIIEKQIHVYIVGRREYRTIYPVLDFEGDTCILYNETKSSTMIRIKEVLKYSNKEYMPDPYMQRIFYIPYEKVSIVEKDSAETEYSTLESIKNNIDADRTLDMYIFNRLRLGNMLYTSEWSCDEDISKPKLNTYKTTATHILREIFKEVI